MTLRYQSMSAVSTSDQSQLLHSAAFKSWKTQSWRLNEHKYRKFLNLFQVQGVCINLSGGISSTLTGKWLQRTAWEEIRLSKHWTTYVEGLFLTAATFQQPKHLSITWTHFIKRQLHQVHQAGDTAGRDLRSKQIKSRKSRNRQSTSTQSRKPEETTTRNSLTN